MDPRVQVLTALERMDSASYYDLLAVGAGVAPKDLQEAFHRFALVYHPDQYIDGDQKVRDAAQRVFARGVEAYRVLRDRELTRRYDARLAAGQLRLSPADHDEVAHRTRGRSATPTRGVAPEPSARQAAFFAHARTEQGWQIAGRVQELLAQQRHRQALEQLRMLETIEPDNQAVRERADKLAAYLKRWGDRVG
jgi:DnaJ-class molecular chaperone